MDWQIRAATAGDADTMRRIVRQARINPTGLDWRRFLVAEAGGQVVGVGQVKSLRDGTRELASLAIVREWRWRGLGGGLTQALLAREGGEVHLICSDDLEGYYRRFGFARLADAEAPRSLRGGLRMGRTILRLARLFGAPRVRLIPMRRPAPAT